HTDYARNTTGTWKLNYVAQTLITDCAGTTLAGTQTLYDGSATIGAIALDGACLPTKTLALAAVSGPTLTWAQTGRTDHDEYAYLIRSDGANTVTSKKLGPNGNQIVSYTLYDGRFRPRQTQTPAFGGGRMITDTAYNQRGDAVTTSVFYNSGDPSDALVAFN